MGVKKLWQILAPAGRYISLQSLEGKVLALDASIWILRILHGTFELPSADIILMSLIKKLAVLLSLGIKPIFVFDGCAPLLKRRTLRQRQAGRQDRMSLLKKKVQLHFVNHIQGKKTKLKQQQQQQQYQKQPTGLDAYKQQLQIKLMNLHYQELADQYPQLRLDKIAFQNLSRQHKKSQLKQITNLIAQRIRLEQMDMDDIDCLTRHSVAAYLKQIKIKSKLQQVRGQLQIKLNELKSQNLKKAVDEVDLSQFKNISHGKLLSKNGQKYYIHLTKDLPINIKRLRDDKKQQQRNKFRNLIKRKDKTQQQLQKEQLKLDCKQIEQEIDYQKLQSNMFMDSQSQSHSFNNKQIPPQPAIQSSFISQRIKSYKSQNQTKKLQQPIIQQQSIVQYHQSSQNIEILNFQSASLIKRQTIKSDIKPSIQPQESTKSFNKINIQPSIQTKSKIQTQSLPQYQTKTFNQSNNNTIIPQMLSKNVTSIQQIKPQDLQKYKKLMDLSQLNFDDIKKCIIQLLQLYGLPYIQAPSQAQAQCAKLQLLGLVHGTITQDSDALLFGSKNVYRGFFSSKTNQKTIQHYSSKTIQKQLGLTRNKLINLALLLGSDYTIGVRGIGIVNAMQIIAVYDTIQKLKIFKSWAQKADSLLDNVEQHYQEILPKQLIFKQMHKNYKKQWIFQQNFPSLQIVQAYLHPKVDQSQQKFTFGKPAILMLKQVCRLRFRWQKQKIQQIFKDLQKFKPQRKITDYIEGPVGKFNSVRMQFALQNMNDGRRTILKKK